MRTATVALLALASACAEPTTDGPLGAVAHAQERAAGPANDREIDARTQRVVLRLRAGSDAVPMIGRSTQFVAISDAAVQHVLGRFPYPPVPELACAECGRPQPPIGMPSHHPIQLADRVVFSIYGPRPGYPARGTCPDGASCTHARALPIGRYRLVVVSDTFSCDEVRFTVPLTRNAEGGCRRIDEGP